MILRLRPLLATIALIGAAFATAQTEAPKTPSLADDMGITQKLGETVDLKATFKDESGATTTIGEILTDRPVVILPVYFTCPSGCPVIIENLMKTVGKLNASGRTNRINIGNTTDIRVGKDFDVIFLSLNPTETPDIAAKKKAQILRGLEDQSTANGWHLLTGDLDNIKAATNSLGFRWAYRPMENVLNHPTGTVTVTPKGKIVGYTIGNDLPSIIFESNLDNAKNDVVGFKADQTRMFGCIRLSPTASKYRPTVENALRITGVSFALIMMCWIGFLTFKYRQPALPEGGLPKA